MIFSQCIITLSLFIFSVDPHAGAALQDEESGNGAATEELSASSQPVAVDEVVDDSDIRDRLLRILEATTYFEDPGITVSDGVVFLSGKTNDSAHKKWAGDIVAKTEDVVAVVNQITVKPKALWNLDPAWEELRNLGQQVVRALPLFAIGLLVLLITIMLSRILGMSATKLLAKRVESVLVRDVLSKFISAVTIVVGIYIFLRISGLTRLAVTLVGGTGVLGIVLGFAFRDIAENFLASLLLSLQRPFSIGDTIEVAGYVGVVRRVSSRGTMLMDFDGNYVQIANATVYKSTIKNFTANPNTRTGFTVGIGYDSSISRAQEIMLEVMQSHSAVLNDPAPNILVEELGSSSVTLRALFWIDMQKHSKAKVKSAVVRLTLRALELNSISIPDDAREIIFPKGVPVRMIERGERDFIADAQKERLEVIERTESTEEVVKPEGDLSSEVEEIRRQSEQAPPREARDEPLAPVEAKS